MISTASKNQFKDIYKPLDSSQFANITNNIDSDSDFELDSNNSNLIENTNDFNNIIDDNFININYNNDINKSKIKFNKNLMLNTKKNFYKKNFTILSFNDNELILTDDIIKPKNINTTNNKDKFISNFFQNNTENSDQQPEFDGIRYKIKLYLSQREIQLIKDSWFLLINEDIPTKDSYSIFFNRIIRKTDTNNTINENDNISINSSSSKLVNLSGGGLFFWQLYENLIAMDPMLEQLFPTLKHQTTSFAIVLENSIENLNDLSQLDEYLQNLGKRHSRVFGIQRPNFELMGIAFLKTLQDRLSYLCTSEIIKSWSRLYSFLANSILQFGIDPIVQFNKKTSQLELTIPDFNNNSDTTVYSIQNTTNTTNNNSSLDFIKLVPVSTENIASNNNNTKKNKAKVKVKRKKSIKKDNKSALSASSNKSVSPTSSNKLTSPTSSNGKPASIKSIKNNSSAKYKKNLNYSSTTSSSSSLKTANDIFITTNKTDTQLDNNKLKNSNNKKQCTIM